MAPALSPFTVGIVFGPMFFRFNFWCSQSGSHPAGNWAKLGYKLNMKVKKRKIPLSSRLPNGTYHKNLAISQEKNNSKTLGNFGVNCPWKILFFKIEIMFFRSNLGDPKKHFKFGHNLWVVYILGYFTWLWI
jgi:hypothetical protein